MLQRWPAPPGSLQAHPRPHHQPVRCFIVGERPHCQHTVHPDDPVSVPARVRHTPARAPYLLLPVCPVRTCRGWHLTPRSLPTCGADASRPASRSWTSKTSPAPCRCSVPLGSPCPSSPGVGCSASSAPPKGSPALLGPSSPVAVLLLSLCASLPVAAAAPVLGSLLKRWVRRGAGLVRVAQERGC